MRGFLLRSLITAFGVWVATVIVPGIEATSAGTVFGAGLLLVLVNGLVRPIVVFLTLPVTLLTLGLFLLIINAGMLGLVGKMLDGLSIASAWSALFGAIVISIVSSWASWTIGPSGRVEVLSVRGRRRDR